MAKLTHDPVTGDELTKGEAVAWRVQWIIRRWTFLIAITVLTAIAWTYVAFRVGWALGTGPVAVLTWWNLCASYLALLIESVVGMAMYHQVQRDALIMREIRRVANRVESVAELIHEHQLRSER